MMLIGREEILATDCGIEEIIRFYGDLFGRLPKDVEHTGDLTRFIAYQSPVDSSAFRHFFGIEVEKIESIPTGLTAWDLGENERTIWESRDGRDTIVCQEQIEWIWRDRSNGRTVGEFTIPGSEHAPYWMSMNSYVKPQEIGRGNDDVHLVDYDPSWPDQFEEMTGWLRTKLGTDLLLRVEHYGSTSIPNMPAKPVIDILVEVPSFPEAKKQMIPLFNSEEWEYCWYSNHMMFIKRNQIMESEPITST